MLTKILDPTTGFVAQNDIRGSIIYMNPTDHRFTGIALGTNLQGLTAADFYPPKVMDQPHETAMPTTTHDGVRIGETTA